MKSSAPTWGREVCSRKRAPKEKSEGNEDFRQFFEICFQGVPDFSYTLEKIVPRMTSSSSTTLATGTHRGAWIGIPGTAKRTMRTIEQKEGDIKWLKK